MFYPKVPVPSDGQPIAIEDIEAIAAEIKRRQIIPGPGLSATTTAEGTALSLTRREASIHAVTRTGGIPAATSSTQMSSATVDVWMSDSTGKLTSAGYSITGWNKSTKAAVGATAGTPIMLDMDNGGLYVARWEECSS